MAKKVDKNIKAHCYNCGTETNQSVLFNDSTLGPQEIVWRNDDGDKAQSVWMVAADIWTLSKCLGCDKFNFKHIFRTTPDRETDKVFLFPKKPLRRSPDWIIKIPIKYCTVLQEIYDSLNEGLLVLPMMGLRTVLDIYIVDKVGDVGTFKQKLNNLVAKNFITSSKAKVLETAIEAGNASAHRGYRPDVNTLIQVLEIVEHLLQSEIVDRPAEDIRRKVPPRV